MASWSSIPAKRHKTIPKSIMAIDNKGFSFVYFLKILDFVISEYFILTIYQLTDDIILQLDGSVPLKYLLFCRESKQKVKISLKNNGLLDIWFVSVISSDRNS